MRKPANIAASVHDRLLSLSVEQAEDFNRTLLRYAAERFLHRLGESDMRDRFVLKGAAIFAIWGGTVDRPTRDVDLTGVQPMGLPDLVAAFRKICGTPVADDGLVFDTETIQAEPIRGSAEHGGIRLRFDSRLGSARIRMQIDVGFGDAVEPPPEIEPYPTLLDFPAPRIRVYPKEAVVAEKLHALVTLGEGNSRMKDLHDLHAMLSGFDFDGECLARSITSTFGRRNTFFQAEMPAALTASFFREPARADQWKSYLNRNGITGIPRDLAEVGEKLIAFFSPIWVSKVDRTKFTGTWRAPGFWKDG